MSRKSLCVTYFLWLFGGIFGLHHFYLGRDRQAFLWWMSCGGYFGIGWLCDLWMIPKYVMDANDDPKYIEDLATKMRKHRRPPNSTVRLFLQLVVADAFGYLTLAALPAEYIPEEYMRLAEIFTPLAVAIGVHMVGNLGREEGSFILAVVPAYAVYPLYFFGYKSVFLTSFVCACSFNSYAKQWRRVPSKPKPVWKRVLILTVCGSLYLSLWASYLYFNCVVVSEDNEEVKCRDAAKHFFRSPMWNDFLFVVKEIWEVAQHQGWREVWKHVLEAFDPQGKANALKVLGVNESATEHEIIAQYRKLSRRWHPDKHKDPSAKELAQEKFIEIAQAYEVLIKSHRAARNAESTS